MSFSQIASVFVMRLCVESKNTALCGIFAAEMRSRINCNASKMWHCK